MAGNAGMGRPKGSGNRRTQEAWELVGDGETPVAFGLRIMRDAAQPIEIQLHGALIAAPFIHPKPQRLGETIELDLPDINTVEGVTLASAKVLTAVANGEISLSVGMTLWLLSIAIARALNCRTSKPFPNFWKQCHFELEPHNSRSYVRLMK
jgi:hypothetical protein